jgi:homoserine kinase type II
MPGAAEEARPPGPARVRSAFAAMAAFHLRLGSERRTGTSPGLERRRDAVAHLIRGGFDAMERSVREQAGPPNDETRPMAMRWLGLARAAAPRVLDTLRAAAGRVVPLQPCLRDARPEHFLFGGDRVTGLVDFGAMDIDCVAGDLARLMGEWLDGDSIAHAEALAAYGRIRPLDADESALIDAFASSSALLIGEHWIRWRYIEHRRFDDPSAAAAGIARGLAHLERLAVG